MRTILVAALLAFAASATAAVAAPPSPPTAPGWPKSLPAGTVIQGPGGGLVLVSARSSGGFAARAFRRDGRRIWTAAREAGCGDCNDGPQPVRLQPDGTFGPIGFDGDYIWAVDRRGRPAEECAGVMSPDGSCVVGRSGFAPPIEAGPRPVVRGLTRGVPYDPWQLVVPGYLWQDEFDVPAMTVADARGIVYVAFRNPVPGVVVGRAISGILVAVDPVARTILWVAEGPFQALTGLTSGVLVAEPGGIAAYRADGTVAWRQAIPLGQEVVPGTVVHDPYRGRVYLGRLPAGPPVSVPGVTALDAATGAEAWNSPVGDRARLLSVGRGGRVYLAVDRAGGVSETALRGVRAVRWSDGRAVWERRTRLPVQGARELVNGTVAISAGDPSGSGPGVLTLLDPR